MHILSSQPLGSAKENDEVHTVVLCSGKHFYALQTYLQEQLSPQAARHYAFIRIEQLAPFPIVELASELKRYSGAKRFIWSQLNSGIL
ncbi:unnamed protein product [Protopolystoma xenopodis]|uniref:2-oxoglutarate dehydrogenase E1 component/KDG C-terminal domain-containing protein n=1 Tax=Protopolystoma xenopodis TaxID=117903 RepID=A0A3S5B728_9PLAT|nr:unnamed protein product [Protopolystoma xenopodis]